MVPNRSLLCSSALSLFCCFFAGAMNEAFPDQNRLEKRKEALKQMGKIEAPSFAIEKLEGNNKFVVEINKNIAFYKLLTAYPIQLQYHKEFVAIINFFIQELNKNPNDKNLQRIAMYVFFMIHLACGFNLYEENLNESGAVVIPGLEMCYSLADYLKNRGKSQNQSTIFYFFSYFQSVSTAPKDNVVLEFAKILGWYNKKYQLKKSMSPEEFINSISSYEKFIEHETYFNILMFFRENLLKMIKREMAEKQELAIEKTPILFIVKQALKKIDINIIDELNEKKRKRDDDKKNIIDGNNKKRDIEKFQYNSINQSSVLLSEKKLKEDQKEGQVISFEDMQKAWNQKNYLGTSIRYNNGKISFGNIDCDIYNNKIISINKIKKTTPIAEDAKKELRDIINKIGSYGAVHLKGSLDYFLKEALLCDFGQCELGKPKGAWYRKVFEEKFVSYINSNIHSKKDLTYVSLGSGSLWQDFVLLDALVQKGCSFKNFVFIDTGYNQVPWIADSESYNNGFSYQNKIWAEGGKNQYSLEGGILFFMQWFNNVPIYLFTNYDEYINYLNDTNVENKVTLNADILVCIDIPYFSGFWILKEQLKDKGVFAILADEFPAGSGKTGFVMGVKGKEKAIVSNFVGDELQTKEEDEVSMSYSTGKAKFD